jgi:DNA-binding IclR family transcriptional regulator
VVVRALSLLAAFDADHRALGLAELSRRAQIPRSTTVRLAARLIEWGALERDDRGRYVIGLRLFEVASLAPRSHGLREVALPYLEDLHEISRQHVLLAVRDGGEALLVERLSAHGAVEIAYRVGGRMPLHDTGVGLVLLAGAGPDVRDVELARLGPSAAAELRRRLAQVQRLGIAVFDRARPAPVSSIAAPIRGPRAPRRGRRVRRRPGGDRPAAVLRAGRTGHGAGDFARDGEPQPVQVGLIPTVSVVD